MFQFIDLTSHFIELDPDLVLHVVYLASPETLVLIHLVYIIHRLNDIQEDLSFVFLLVATNDTLHSSHQHQFILERVRGLLIHHSVEGIAHDCDEHV